MAVVAPEPLAEPAALGARLRKRHRHLAKWAGRAGLTAYRLFDRDIPGYHFAVDRYDRYALVAEYPWKAGDALHERRRAELLAALVAECGFSPGELIVKTHERHRAGESQYGRAGPEVPDVKAIVTEGPLRFEVNLGPYLDVGLFLDHRTTRRFVRERCRRKRVLNLFCYTGAFTVAAAVGGAAATVSVDLSGTYLGWAQRNLALNGITGAAGTAGDPHTLVEADVLAYTQSGPPQLFDLIVCDPPPSSVSKKARSFDVQRDHESLLLGLRGWLAPGGAILFSCNLGGFALSPAVSGAWPTRELTPASLPLDFQKRAPGRGALAPTHRAWLLGSPWLVASA